MDASALQYLHDDDIHEEATMFITRIGDQRCCTCNHWQGVRVTENDGYIYSLKDVEGICHDLKPTQKGHESCMSLSFPSSSCPNWREWTGPAIPEGRIADDKTHRGTAVAGLF